MYITFASAKQAKKAEPTLALKTHRRNPKQGLSCGLPPSLKSLPSGAGAREWGSEQGSFRYAIEFELPSCLWLFFERINRIHL